MGVASAVCYLILRARLLGGEYNLQCNPNTLGTVLYLETIPTACQPHFRVIVRRFNMSLFQPPVGPTVGVYRPAVSL